MAYINHETTEKIRKALKESFPEIEFNVRALDGGDKKFQGLISRFWLEPLERLGFNPEQHGSDTDAVIAFLKRKYSMTVGRNEE